MRKREIRGLEARLRTRASSVDTGLESWMCGARICFSCFVIDGMVSGMVAWSSMYLDLGTVWYSEPVKQPSHAQPQI